MGWRASGLVSTAPSPCPLNQGLPPRGARPPHPRQLPHTLGSPWSIQPRAATPLEPDWQACNCTTQGHLNPKPWNLNPEPWNLNPTDLVPKCPRCAAIMPQKIQGEWCPKLGKLRPGHQPDHQPDHQQTQPCKGCPATPGAAPPCPLKKGNVQGWGTPPAGPQSTWEGGWAWVKTCHAAHAAWAAWPPGPSSLFQLPDGAAYAACPPGLTPRTPRGRRPLWLVPSPRAPGPTPRTRRTRRARVWGPPLGLASLRPGVHSPKPLPPQPRAAPTWGKAPPPQATAPHPWQPLEHPTKGSHPLGA